MRQIEKDMLAAISAGRDWHGANTRYVHRDRYVALHDNIIAKLGASGWSFNLCGWNTPTTRSRLNALGAGVRSIAGVPHVMGRPVPLVGWWSAS